MSARNRAEVTGEGFEQLFVIKWRVSFEAVLPPFVSQGTIRTVRGARFRLSNAQSQRRGLRYSRSSAPLVASVNFAFLRMSRSALLVTICYICLL